MTPDDLALVDRSWRQLRLQREQLVAELSRHFSSLSLTALPAESRAEFLVGAVDELVGLLHAPSHLATCARAVGERWPDPLKAPSYAIEGRGFMAAASTCSPAWSDAIESAWRQAWLLLSDVLAAETLSPFGDPNPDGAFG